MARPAVLYKARERRRAAADFKKFGPDIASPFDLGAAAPAAPLPNAYPVPANARLAVSFSVPVAAGQLTINYGDRALGTTALAADQVRLLDWVERAVEVTIQSAIAGTVTLYVLDEWNRPSAIAQGTFA